jgi:hypothetical protein
LLDFGRALSEEISTLQEVQMAKRLTEKATVRKKHANQPTHSATSGIKAKSANTHGIGKTAKTAKTAKAVKAKTSVKAKSTHTEPRRTGFMWKVLEEKQKALEHTHGPGKHPFAHAERSVRPLDRSQRGFGRYAGPRRRAA